MFLQGLVSSHACSTGPPFSSLIKSAPLISHSLVSTSIVFPGQVVVFLFSACMFGISLCCTCAWDGMSELYILRLSNRGLGPSLYWGFRLVFAYFTALMRATWSEAEQSSYVIAIAGRREEGEMTSITFAGT